MKHIKLYEKYISSPVNNMYIGDYILVNTYLFNDEFELFINNNIGKIVNFRRIDNVAVVEYENIPNKILSTFKKVARWRITPKSKDEQFFIYITDINMNDITHFSKNKEELEEILKERKYNL